MGGDENLFRNGMLGGLHGTFAVQHESSRFVHVFE
jgi:hypothetical protein